MSCDTVTESFIHDFMFTCDTLPSHLCPRCCEIKQNSWVPRVISLEPSQLRCALEQGHVCCAVGTGSHG